MKRQKLVRHLRRHGCTLKREGRNHSVFVNEGTGHRSTVPRHREIGDDIVNGICDQLGIARPSSRG